MKNSFTNLFKGNITIKKNQPRVSGFKTPSTFFNIKSIYLVIAFLIITGTAESNWIPQEKTTSTDAMSSITSDEGKKDSLPEGVTQDWLNNLRDENGNSIVSESNLNRDSQELPEDPEEDAFQRKIFNGLGGPDSQFGYSVSSAGDVNGDGFDDIIIGGNSGKAYIYYGGLIMNTVADVVMTGEVSFINFGSSVSSAGDLNGDGYSDVIIGASGNSSLNGRAYVFFGGLTMNNVADVTMTGEAVSDAFGYSVSSAGDVNGDGYSDVIVGAYSYGRAYIFFGGIAMDNSADVVFTGDLTSTSFGSSVSSAGDVNGDGFSDVIVGAQQSNKGKTYIYFGSSSMDDSADVKITNEAPNGITGISVSSAGDVNGDGFSDVIVGTTNFFLFDYGRVYIYLGGAVFDTIADVTFSMSDELTFGVSVSSAGDVNGDGYSDILIGAGSFFSIANKAYIYFGGSYMNNVVDATMIGETLDSYFGFSVSSAGDVNGDGYSDVIVGANGYSSRTGRVYLYDYFMKNEITQDLSLTGETPNDEFGYSVSSAGDVNGDGYSDLIIGAYRFASYTGKVYVCLGGASMDSIADVTITGDSIGYSIGRSVSSAGDVNGDGYSDIIVGANGYSSNTGKAYIYYGGSSMNNTADLTMKGEDIDNNFGYSVSSAGDVNGDGYSDVIVGASSYNSSSGKTYIYFGGSSMDTTADLIMTIPFSTGSYFGYSVSSAGDVNGDGYSDVIVGAWGYSSGIGKAYVYFGGSSMNAVVDLTMTGETGGSNFGQTVSSAGDVNGDGYSDMIVGAWGVLRKSYIFFGGAIMDNIADVTMTSVTGSNFGFSVSSAGDINGDGFSDVIIGATGVSSGIGSAYVYYGGNSMDNIVDVNMSGESISNIFGASVSSAGDVNGDGYSDLIVGANGYSSNTGKAYIYQSSAISVKPILNYVKDVPNDQGGFVNLKWARSSFDVNGNDLITDYVVQRSYPPSGGNFSWENIAYIPATKESFYTYTADTPFDSTQNNSGTLYFRITARTSEQSQYWRSGILFGRSIDNIAPPVVSPFNATTAGSYINISWGSNSAPDLFNYVLFRSYSNSINPYTETPLATSTNLTFIDNSPLTGFYYYYIVAQDIHGNYSPVAFTEIPNTTLNLTMFINGFYNAGTNSQISDTITVQLRNTLSPFEIVDEAKSVVSSSGNAVLKFVNAPSGNYYLSIKHRNSIETWSASGVSITSNGSVNYNLSSSSAQAYGNNMPQIDTSPKRYGIFSGDENQDGYVNLTDIVNVYNNAAIFVNGYVASDMNGDNLTDLTDVVITFNNANEFVSAITP